MKVGAALDTESIDLIKLYHILRRRLVLIVSLAILGVTLSGLYTFVMVQERYTADVLMYIWEDKVAGENSSVQMSDLALFSALVNDYQVLAKSRLVTNEVAKELQLDPAASEKLSDQITVSTKNNTRHLIISVTDTDPVFAAAVANKTASVFSTFVVEKMGAANVRVIDEAVAPKNPSFPNKPMFLALGLLIGLMFGVGLSLLLELLDTRVKTNEDVEQLTGYSMLGVIPEFEHSKGVRQ
jgi:capsular polysaccharide biosynthesis protein